MASDEVIIEDITINMSGQSHLYLGLWAEIGKQRETTTNCVQKGAEWSGSVAMMEWERSRYRICFLFLFPGPGHLDYNVAPLIWHRNVAQIMNEL